MSITKTLGRVGIVLSVAATIATSQTNPVASVKIGNLTWTKQNLNIETPDSWCYENNESNCAKYGRLYTWKAAKNVCPSMGGKWRLPTKQDWDNLVDYAGGKDIAGKKLKSKSGWDNNGNGTDDYGFSAMPGGYRYYDDNSDIVGSFGYWWSASVDGSGNAYLRFMYSDYDYVNEYMYSKSNGFSVRCAQD